VKKKQKLTPSQHFEPYTTCTHNNVSIIYSTCGNTSFMAPCSTEKMHAMPYNCQY